MELTIHLDPDRAQKLTYLQQQTHQDPTSLLSQAIDKTYQQLNPPQSHAYPIFEALGLIGCMDSGEDLPTTRYPAIREQLQQKMGVADC
jgi:hypothetical protein